MLCFQGKLMYLKIFFFSYAQHFDILLQTNDMILKKGENVFALKVASILHSQTKYF